MRFHTPSAVLRRPRSGFHPTAFTAPHSDKSTAEYEYTFGKRGHCTETSLPIFRSRFSSANCLTSARQIVEFVQQSPPVEGLVQSPRQIVDVLAQTRHRVRGKLGLTLLLSGRIDGRDQFGVCRPRFLDAATAAASLQRYSIVADGLATCLQTLQGGEVFANLDFADSASWGMTSPSLT